MGLRVDRVPLLAVDVVHAFGPVAEGASVMRGEGLCFINNTSLPFPGPCHQPHRPSVRAGPICRRGRPAGVGGVASIPCAERTGFAGRPE